jgi:hypothetical protein
MDKLRAKLALRVIGWARALLRMPATASGDFDICTHCGATGCEDGTADHSPDCPLVTGVHVVTLQDMWPGGPVKCDCGTVLWPGARFSHIWLEPTADGTPVGQVACLGCVAQHELLGAL